MLSNLQVHSVTLNVKVKSSAFLSITTLAVLTSDSPTVRIKTFCKAETHSIDPSIVQLVIDKHFEFYVTVVSQINEVYLKVIPVVKGKSVGIDFLIEVEPAQRRTD